VRDKGWGRAGVCDMAEAMLHRMVDKDAALGILDWVIGKGWPKARIHISHDYNVRPRRSIIRRGQKTGDACCWCIPRDVHTAEQGRFDREPYGDAYLHPQ